MHLGRIELRRFRRRILFLPADVDPPERAATNIRTQVGNPLLCSPRCAATMERRIDSEDFQCQECGWSSAADQSAGRELLPSCDKPPPRTSPKGEAVLSSLPDLEGSPEIAKVGAPRSILSRAYRPSSVEAAIRWLRSERPTRKTTPSLETRSLISSLPTPCQPCLSDVSAYGTG